ncbi:MAG: segregation/condensation protein A [Patescibacteria group bacterium]|nr:segregation/condensation protein A [Patescibacteria group bacterium]
MPLIAPTVKTAVYEGPLDLLLELIEKRKLLINDISLASVTDEYISRVGTMESLPVGETAEFVALAATLLLIKSRSLLPSLMLSDDESRDIKELEYRLAMYQIIKEGSHLLGKQLISAALLYDGAAAEQEPLYIPDASATPQSLLATARMLIDGFPQNLALPKVNVKKIVSLEEMIEKLAARLTTAMRLSFKEFTGHDLSAKTGKNLAAVKPEIIVSFLALLELIKQGILKASQDQKFGDIFLESDAVTTPSYE